MQAHKDLSVIVCTYNRERYIGQCLEHLIHQDVDKGSYEVIIVDNNSTDNTGTICEAVVAKQESFKYYLETNQGHSFSRNRGIEESKGEIVAFLDDDAFVANDYVTNLISFFANHSEVQAIGGKINPRYEGATPKWMSKYLLPLVAAQDMGETPKAFTGRKFPIGANMAFRRAVFEKYGNFNVNLGRKGTGLEGGDEKEVFLRLKADKIPIFYVPNIVVDHIIPEKRVTKEYIKGLAVGVGTSERKRIKEAGAPDFFLKIVDELIKSLGTIILFFLYFLRGKSSAGIMLLKFRYWVVKGLMTRN